MIKIAKKEKEKEKEKEKDISTKRVASNTLFALNIVWESAPLYVIMYFFSTVWWGIMGFLSETYALRLVVNTAQTAQGIDRVIWFVVILGIVNIIGNAGLNYFWQVPTWKETRKFTSHAEGMLFRKAAKVELACYENPKFYDKYVKAMNEIHNRIMRTFEATDGMLDKIISLTANSLLLFVIDPWLLVFAMLPMVFGIFKRKEVKALYDQEDAKKPVVRRVEYVRRTFYLGEYAKEMRVGGMSRLLLADLKTCYEEIRDIIKKHGGRRALFGYIQQVGLEVFTILGATLYAVYRTMVTGDMLVGDCLVVLGSIGSISRSINNVIQNLADFREQAHFINDVRYFLDYEPSIADGSKAMPAQPDTIEVKDLSFRYEGAEQDALKHINLSLHRGERIALVGANGSGKTTLVKMLLRLYDPTEGCVSLGGVDVRDLPVAAYRGAFSSVFQDFKILSATVRQNVTLSTEQAEDEAIITALKEAGIYDKISTFEKGIDTVLTREFDDKGENLSVGEAQKVSLARVFYRNTPFVILDEPSSALDPIAEYTMFENMMRATEGRGVIFISHRLSSAVLADRVLLMENGEITESGTHAELMEKNGTYAAMFRRQAENYLGSEVSENG